MPIHNWAPIPPGLFHHFHQHWSIEIAAALNRGLLPEGLSALVEQRSGVVEPDVLAIEAEYADLARGGGSGDVATMEPPATQIVRRTTTEIYANRANRIVVKHHLGRIVAVIEILSRGNKDSRAALRDFVDKTIAFLRKGVHVLVIDVFPPTPRDPQGIHKAIWDEILEEDFEFPAGKDRILASYKAGDEKIALVEPVAVGDVLPDMALYLTSGLHVMVPLEPTYQATWDAAPQALRVAVETGVIPESEL